MRVLRQAVRAWEDRSCFTDEVAIDFPSVSTVVERIFDAFLDQERPAPLAAVVRLSEREAFRGARVPVDVPLRNTCRACGGRGETWMDPCPACHGTGESIGQQRLWLSVPPGVTDAARFLFSVTTASAPPMRIEVKVAVVASA
jgi:hypothetical protein